VEMAVHAFIEAVRERRFPTDEESYADPV